MHTDKAGAGQNRHRRTRYVATCQQLLVLGVVFAALIPAATIVSLDVVRPGQTGQTGQTGQARSPGAGGALAAYLTAATTPSTVPTAPVNATVDEIPLTTKGSADPSLKRRVGGSTGGYGAGPNEAGEPTEHASVRAAAGKADATVVTSTPQSVTGFGTVGLTWAHGENIDPADLTAQIRTEKNGAWSDWKGLDYDVDGPDADTAEGKATRPGTMEALVGHVDRVQARLTVKGAQVPTDLKLAVIDPGTPTSTASQKAAIDTGKGDSSAVTGDSSTTSTAATTSSTTSSTTSTTWAPASGGGEAAAVLAAAAYTPKPQI